VAVTSIIDFLGCQGSPLDDHKCLLVSMKVVGSSVLCSLQGLSTKERFLYSLGWPSLQHRGASDILYAE